MSPGCRSPGSASAARRAGPRPTEPRAGSRITRRWLPLGPIPVNVCGLEWGLGGLVSREREAAVTGVFAPWELGKAANRAPPHLPPESQKPPPVAAPLGEAPDSRAQLLAEAGAPRGVPPGSLPASAVVHAAFTTTHVTEESVSRGMRRGAEETPGAWEGPGAGGVGGSRGDTQRGRPRAGAGGSAGGAGFTWRRPPCPGAVPTHFSLSALLSPGFRPGPDARPAVEASGGHGRFR